MTMLPNIPRLYTALAEVLAVLLYARHLPRRFHRQTAVTVVWALVLGIFLHKTGYVPLAWWVPCMLCAVLLLYGYLWGSRRSTGWRHCTSPPGRFCWQSLLPAQNGSCTAAVPAPERL